MQTTIDRDWLDIAPAYGQAFGKILETALDDVLASEEMNPPFAAVFNSLTTASATLIVNMACHNPDGINALVAAMSKAVLVKSASILDEDERAMEELV